MKTFWMSCFLLFFFTSCQTSPVERSESDFERWASSEGKVRVLCTIEMLSDLARQVGGEHISCITLIKGDLDPHSYELVKGDDEKFAYADLIFFNGLGLEHSPSLHRQLKESEHAVGVGDHIRQGDSSLILQAESLFDPHIWMDISLWSRSLEFIADALSQKDPQHAAYYKERETQAREVMLAEHEKIRNALQSIPSQERYLVTSHDAFRYFCRAYLAEERESMEEWELRVEAPEGLAPDSQLSASDIQRIVRHIQTFGVQVIFPESNVSKDSIRKITLACEELGLTVRICEEELFGDAMGAPGSEGGTYLGMIRHNARVIEEGLRGGKQ